MANAPAPTELPRTLSTVEQLRDAFNDRIRTIVEWITSDYVSNPLTSDLDAANFKIVNLGDPRDDQDAVNLRTLKKGSGQPDQPVSTVVNSGLPFGDVAFSVIERNYGYLQLEARARSKPPLNVWLECPSVDETDTAWYAFGPDIDAVQTQFSRAILGTSAYGRVFAVGDYILFNDPQLGDGGYRFEVARITAIDNTAGTWTLLRGVLGSVPLAHVAGVPVYRLVDQFFVRTIYNKAPQMLELEGANMCVIAVRSSVQSTYLGNRPDPYPGVRTLNGAIYTLGWPDTLALGSVSLLRLKVASPHSIRNAFFEFDGSAGTGGQTALTLAYITPARDAAFQISRITINNGHRESYSNSQQGKRFPTYADVAWPPNTRLPLMAGALDANGKLQTGFTVDPSRTATMEEDGELDFITTAVPGTPGVGLRGSILT